MIGIIAFTDKGRELGYKIGNIITQNLNMEVDYFPGAPMKGRDYVAMHFEDFHGFIFIGAVGICFRLVASHIRQKDVDPAILVIDEKCDFVIPVLSGHIGGANELARHIGKLTGAIPVITTATDINNKFAADVWATKLGAVILDTNKIMPVSSAVLRDEDVGIYSPQYSIIGNLPNGLVDITLNKNITIKNGISISLSGEYEPFENTLQVIPKIITLGAGCKRDTDENAFREFVLGFLRENHISIKAIEKIASIDLKKNEKCLLSFSSRYKIPFNTFSAKELMRVSGDFHHSDFVEKTTGADNVAERSAVFASGGKLIVKRTARDGMTLALAAREWRCEF